MKVKISYTIEDSEIPNEIVDFLRKANNKTNQGTELVENLCRRLSVNFDLESIDLYINDINKARRQLTLADLTFSDCHDILDGLKNLIIQQKQQAEEQLRANQHPETPKQEFSDLQVEVKDE